MKLNMIVLFKVLYLSLFHIFGMLMVRGAISYTSSPSLDDTSTTRNKCSLTCTDRGILIESDSVKVCSGQTTCEWSSWRVEKYSCSEVNTFRRRIHAVSNTSIDCKTTSLDNAFCSMTCDSTGSTCTDDGCLAYKCHIYISYNSTTYASQKLEVVKSIERRREQICSQWSAWALKACMEGTFHNLHRERECIYPPDIDLSNKLSCDLSESRYQKCNNESIETNLTSLECSWSPWEQCSVSCGMAGQQRRTRKSQIFSFTNVSSCDPSAIKMTTDQIKYFGNSTYCTANKGSIITSECIFSSNCSNEKMTCNQTEYTQYRKCTGNKCSGDLSDNCKLVCNDGKISVQIFGGRISHVCIGNPKAPCDWEMEQSDCFKATAIKIRLLDLNTPPVKCIDMQKMNNSCSIKMDCGYLEYKNQCDDCPDCYGTCTTEISSCNITTTTTHQLTNDIYNTVNVLRVLQKREDIRRCDREWSAWSWTQCNNKIWNQHRYRNCRYPAYVSNSNNCHLSESNYIHCSNEDALETPHTQIPCNWSPWESCSTSCGRGVQNRTQGVCSLSFRNLPPCDITAIKMASSCQEIDVNLSTWTSWDMGKGGNIGQRVRSGVCINQRPNCKRFIYEYIETKSCGSNLCTAESQSSKASPVIGQVIGSVVAAVAVVMVMVAVLLLVLRRQKQKKDGIAKETETNAVTNTAYNMQMESDMNTYDDLLKRKSQHVYGTLDSTDEIEGEYSFVEDSNTTKHHSDSNDNYFVLEKEKTSRSAEPQILDVGENYFILDKQNIMTTSVLQQMGGEDNYFVLDKEGAENPSISKEVDGGENYFVLDKDGMADMTIPQQSDVKEDNYFVLDKESAENPSISKEADGGENYFVLDKEGMADMTIPQQSDVKKDNDFVLDKEEAIKASISKEADGGENYLVLDKDTTQKSVVEEENYFVLEKMAHNNEIEGQITLS